jgi:hypothetical protein
MLICYFFPTESRSNSMGHALMQSPSDMFGSLISDTEDFLEDLQTNHRTSAAFTSSIQTPPTCSTVFVPALMKSRLFFNEQFDEDELSMKKYGKPFSASSTSKEKERKNKERKT